MLSEDQARALIEKSHHAWNRANLDDMLAHYTDDMVFWCNAGDPSGGPVELKGKAPFRKSLETVLRTTLCKSEILSFTYDGEIAHTKARYRLQSLVTGFVLNGTYRQIVHYERRLISRLEEFHDAGRLTAFWQLTADGAKPDQVVWDAEPSSDRTSKPG